MGTRGSRGNKKTSQSNEPKFIRLRKATAVAVSTIFGPTHFVLKSGADTVARGEAEVIHKLLPNCPKEHIIADRHNMTEDKQDAVKDAAKNVKKTFAKMFTKSSGQAADTVHSNEMNHVV